MNYAIAIYLPGGSVKQSTWRFDAEDDEHAIGVAATILGRVSWDSTRLTTSSGRQLMVTAQGIEPMDSHK